MLMNDSNYNKEYYARNKDNPEFMEKKRESSRQSWHKFKEANPEKYQEYLEKKRKKAKEVREFYKKNNPQ
jgi:hypothetical protein